MLNIHSGKTPAEKRSWLQRYRIYILLSTCFAAICLAVIATKAFLDYQKESKAKASEKLISTLRMEAVQEQINGDLDKAENLYTEALSESEKLGNGMNIIEFLSRLVQVKIKNDKLGQTDDLVQLAVALSLAIQNPPANNSILATWLDDMAKAFYSRGEQSTREDVKEFCMKRYLDIKLPTEDHFDNFLVARYNSFTGHLNNDGRYLETIPYYKKECSYYQRTNPGHAANMSGQLVGLYLMAHRTGEAELDFKNFLKLNKGFKNSLDEGLANLSSGQLCEQENKLQEAEILYKKAVQQCMQYNHGSPNCYAGRCIAVLALLEERRGNTAEAAKLFQESLDCYNKSWVPEVTPVNEFLHPDGWVRSGQVFCMEHLSQIALKDGNTRLSRSLNNQAKKIRDKNPHWAACKNPDPDYFYMVCGFYPYPVNFLPTHLRFPLQ